jgi:hypothetical protein
MWSWAMDTSKVYIRFFQRATRKIRQPGHNSSRTGVSLDALLSPADRLLPGVAM